MQNSERVHVTCVHFSRGKELAVCEYTAVHLTGYSDYLTGFCKPFSPPYRCHAGLKNV